MPFFVSCRDLDAEPLEPRKGSKRTKAETREDGSCDPACVKPRRPSVQPPAEIAKRGLYADLTVTQPARPVEGADRAARSAMERHRPRRGGRTWKRRPLTAPSEPSSQLRAEDYLRAGTPGYRRLVIGLVAAAFSTFAVLYCVQPMMPVFSAEFDVPPAVGSLSLSVTTTTVAFCMLVVGRLSDAYGRKGLMTFSLLSVALLTIASAFAPSWPAFLMLRAVEGVALSGVPAVGMAYLAEEVHPRDLASTIGLYIGGNAFGGMLGRVLTGPLLDLTHSWRVTIGVIGVIGLGAAVLFAIFLPPSRRFVAEGSLSLKSLGHAFAVHFRDPGLPWLFLFGFLLMGSFISVYNYSAYRLVAPPFDLSQTLAGAIFVIYLVGGPSSTWFGRRAARYGAPRLLILALALMFCGLVVTASQKLAITMAGVVVFTTGFFGAHGIASGWVSRRPIVARAQATSLYLFCFYMGSSVLGSSGGFFWSGAGWPGIIGLVSALLLAAVLVVLHLARIERGGQSLAQRATE